MNKGIFFSWNQFHGNLSWKWIFFYHLQDAIQETPEDGIIDDENVPADEEMKDENDQGDEQNPPEESSEDAIKDEINPEEVLASGWSTADYYF